MGPWNFVKGRLYEALGDRFTIKRVSRVRVGQPRHRLQGVHDQEQEMILDKALSALSPAPSFSSVRDAGKRVAHTRARCV